MKNLMLTYGIEIVLDKIDINNPHQKNFKDEFTKALNQNVMDLLEKKFSIFLENTEALNLLNQLCYKLAMKIGGNI